MLAHIVLFKLKNKEDAGRVKEKLLGMIGKIPQLRFLEVGLDVFQSERSYDVALYSKFDSLQAMQEYAVHPVHLDVVEFLKELRESTITVDYEL